MNRPIYETGKDCARADVVFKFLSSKGSFIKLPRLHSFDFARIVDKKISSVIELKCRNLEIKSFPTFIISSDKVLRLLHYCETFNLEGSIAILDRSGLYRLDIYAPCTIVLGGRTKKTRDEYDVELISEFEIKYLELVTKEIKYE